MPQISNREQLVKGAVACLKTKGYARTTARDIARASKANLASIGYHFGSKDALLDEALRRVMLDRTRRVGEATTADPGATAIEGMKATFRAVFEIFERHRPMLVAFVEAMAQVERSANLRREMADVYRAVRRAGAARLRAGLGHRAEELETDPEVMASLLIACFDGLLLQWLIDPLDTPDADALVDALADTMRLALKQQPSRRRERTKR